MTNIFIVIAGDPNEENICAVFSTGEKAEAFGEKMRGPDPKIYDSEYRIDVYRVDKEEEG